MNRYCSATCRWFSIAATGKAFPKLVDRLRATIQVQDVSALDGFNAKLIEAGYLDSHSELYSDTRYTHRETRFFKVAEGFPRIAARDLAWWNLGSATTRFF